MNFEFFGWAPAQVQYRYHDILIVIDCARVFDVRAKGVLATTGEACGEVLDPWCAEVYTKWPPRCVYIAVKYQEMRCRPVRVQPISCGCDDTQCEYSRIRDGYEITALMECPPSQYGCPSIPYDFPGAMKCDEKGRIVEMKDARQGQGQGQNERICLPDCPPCPSDPWVVLAEVCVDETGVIETIDNCKCRRLVMSFANTWGHCTVSPSTYPCQEKTTGSVPATAQEKPASPTIKLTKEWGGQKVTRR